MFGPFRDSLVDPGSDPGDPGEDGGNAETIADDPKYSPGGTGETAAFNMADARVETVLKR